MKFNKKRTVNRSIIFGFIILNSIGVCAAAPTTTPEGRIITLADDGQTITLQVNETFLLQLGEGYDWNITIDDQTIIRSVVNVLVVKGAQGIYMAHKEGRSSLTAFGEPVCRRVQPACGAPSREFRIHVAVTGAPKTQGFGVIFAILSLMAIQQFRRR